MTTLRERLTAVFMEQLKENHENSKEMIASNSTSFDEMGMSHTAPGEFAQEEITDHSNLENTGSMANDTEFSGKEDSGCEHCDMVSAAVDKVDDVMDDLASDIVDISVKDEEEVKPEEEDEDEKRLMTLAHESVKDSLLSMFKKKLNESEYGEKSYTVYLWPFAGYQTYPVKVEASHEEEALEKAVAKLEEEGKTAFFADDVEDAEEHQDLYIYVDSTPYGGGCHYVDAQNLRIEEDNSVNESVITKNIKKVVKESNGDDYAGPQDFVPDSRINASAVLNALKKEIGEGSEGIHVDQDQDEKDQKTWIVTQIDEKKLPAELDVINVTLKKDGNKYKVKGMKKDFPAMK